ncbi:hypothetical protein AB0I34_06900 [Kribbella sp. NPDC050281]|uniref:hypothetical protein n=1 Tax=Kribbella sp. NPDC050281 TaxID=3155515 RepID=UPI0033EB8F37
MTATDDRPAGVTEDSSARDRVSVTPGSPGALNKTLPPARCQTCGKRLARKYHLKSIGIRGQINYRKGAQYCSPACRQKAYRQRKAGE